MQQFYKRDNKIARQKYKKLNYNIYFFLEWCNTFNR